MKNYTITVNGNIYNVSVEEGTTAAPTAAPVVTTSAPKTAAPAPVKPAVAPAAPAASSSAGSFKVSSPMPGKIISVKATIGQAIKKGEVILILEAMKMENEIVASQDGIVASVNVSAGQTVEAGTLLATLN